MIYDCFCFFNENDLLDLRLNYLKDIVDKFVIIEANKTNSGISKTQNFDKERFKDLSDKILYIYLEDIPDFSNSWAYENYQRNYITEVLKQQNCSSNDIIIISDLDEIPSISAIKKYLSNPAGIKGLSQNFYNLYLNLFNISETPWSKAKILTYGEFFNNEHDCLINNMCLIKDINKGVTPSKIRLMQHENIQNGGWHFSYMGGVDKIIEKIKCFAHQEFNKDFYTNPERIRECLKNGTDILGRNQSYKKVEIDDSFPGYLRSNLNKFKDYILE